MPTASRNLGKLVCDRYSEIAGRLNAMWFSGVDLDNGLPFLPMKSDEGKAYWNETSYCISFALANRELMMRRICEVIIALYFSAKSVISRKISAHLWSIIFCKIPDKKTD